MNLSDAPHVPFPVNRRGADGLKYHPTGTGGRLARTNPYPPRYDNRSLPPPFYCQPPTRMLLTRCDTRRYERQRLERESRRKDMVLRRAYFDRLLLEEGESEESKEIKRVEGLWDEAEQHAGRKGGDFSMAWLQVPGVSERHIFGFHERHGGTRVRVGSADLAPFLSPLCGNGGI